MLGKNASISVASAFPSAHRSLQSTATLNIWDVLQPSGWLAGNVKGSRNGNPTRDLQMAQTELGIILCAGRWYLRNSLSLRDVEELLEERGPNFDHKQRSGAECNITALSWSGDCDSISRTKKSWRVDETYVRVRGCWCYLYRVCFAKTKDVSGLGCRPLCLRQFGPSIQLPDIIAREASAAIWQA
jgi:hypothetical protein